MNLLEKLTHLLVTLGPIGYLPASGTVATVFTLLILLIFSWFDFSQLFLLRLIVPAVALSVMAIHFVLKWFPETDPPQIVLDEVVGYCFAVCIFPLKPVWLIAAAIFFRLFDILKPLGINKFEKMSGASGIVIDDLLAGFYTQIVIILICIGYDLCFR